MLIDWFTVSAQVVNFLILVWLLKHFLYRPILNAIDAREQRIADELADADAKESEAQLEREAFRRKNEAFELQRTALMKHAADDAKAVRRQLLDEARQAADALSAKREEALIKDAHNLNQAISRRAQEEVFNIARKALMDLAGTGLEQRMAEVFIRRLRETDRQEKERIAALFESAAEPALIRSAYELPEAQRSAIQSALNETFSSATQLRFETAPHLISGIEIILNGQKVAWSIADYLSSLQKGVDELLKERSSPKSNVEPNANEPGT